MGGEFFPAFEFDFATLLEPFLLLLAIVFSFVILYSVRACSWCGASGVIIRLEIDPHGKLKWSKEAKIDL